MNAAKDCLKLSGTAWTAACVVLWAASLSVVHAADAPRFYGEPVKLRGQHIYFTSWKYVRQGSFAWRLEPSAGDAGAWLKGDGGRPARFETSDMPRGIRLVAQSAEKRPLPEGQLAAQVFDEGKYKAWYVMDPCQEPEAFSTKDKILPGHNGHVAYAESTDGVHWERPTLGLIEYAGNRNNNLVWRRRPQRIGTRFPWRKRIRGPVLDGRTLQDDLSGPGDGRGMGSFRTEVSGRGRFDGPPARCRWFPLCRCRLRCSVSRRHPLDFASRTADDPSRGYSQHVLLRSGSPAVRRLRPRLAGERAGAGGPTRRFDFLDHGRPPLDRAR